MAKDNESWLSTWFKARRTRAGAGDGDRQIWRHGARSLRIHHRSGLARNSTAGCLDGRQLDPFRPVGHGRFGSATAVTKDT
jgi:hypothetical protein